MESYNVVVTISTTVCIDAESPDDAIEKVSQALNNGDANMSADIANNIGYSIRNGHYEVTDAIPMDEDYDEGSGNEEDNESEEWEQHNRREGNFYPIMEILHSAGEQLLVDDLKRFDVKVMELATAEEVENLYRTVPNEPHQAAYIKVMDRKTNTVYSRIYVFCAGQEEKCLNGDTYLSNKQHYILVKKGDDTYKVPYPFNCDKTVEALNKKPEKEATLTAAQRLFFWAEYKKAIKLD
mgnify:CR=1 FL=1